MLVYLIDHQDSFTYNLVDWLSIPGIRIKVLDHRADLVGVGKAPLVLSPGPKSPLDAPSTLQLAKTLLGKVPIFGVCLGHQILAHVAGFPVARSVHPLHGLAKTIVLANSFFPNAPKRHFQGASYHSLAAFAPGTLPAYWQIAMREEGTGEIQGIFFDKPGAHQALGVQFHPESFLSSADVSIFQNWWYRQVAEFYGQAKL